MSEEEIGKKDLEDKIKQITKVSVSALEKEIYWDYGDVCRHSEIQDKLRTLYDGIKMASSEIARINGKGVGNYILASHGVVAALEGLDEFYIFSRHCKGNSQDDIAGVGVIGPFEVYRDILAEKEYAVVGYEQHYMYVNIENIDNMLENLKVGNSTCQMK